MLDWVDRDLRQKKERIIVFKNVFNADDFEVCVVQQIYQIYHPLSPPLPLQASVGHLLTFLTLCRIPYVIKLCINGIAETFLQKNPVLITDFRDDIKKECEKFGEVRKVIVFDVSIRIPVSIYIYIFIICLLNPFICLLNPLPFCCTFFATSVAVKLMMKIAGVDWQRFQWDYIVCG